MFFELIVIVNLVNKSSYLKFSYEFSKLFDGLLMVQNASVCGFQLFFELKIYS